VKKSVVTEEQKEKPGKHHLTGYLTGLFALLTCPCHIPIYIMLLSGTAAGTLLLGNRSVALGLFSMLFLLFVFSTTRLLKKERPELDSVLRYGI
jgi:mercuric ion transport protein